MTHKYVQVSLGFGTVLNILGALAVAAYDVKASVCVFSKQCPPCCLGQLKRKFLFIIKEKIIYAKILKKYPLKIFRFQNEF